MRLACALLLLPVPALAGEPDPKVELGRRLFMDPTVSRTGKVSCSSCHLPEHGFSDPRAISEDEFGPSRRHAMPVFDIAAEGAPLHSDGEFGSLEELLRARLDAGAPSVEFARLIRTRRFEEAKAAGRAPDEQAFSSVLFAVQGYGDDTGRGSGFMLPHLRLGIDRRYHAAFKLAFGSTAATTPRIVQAIRAYVVTVRSGESAFDRYRAGAEGALSEAQRRGLALFTGKAGCAGCHVADAPAGERPRFTDGLFHDTGTAYRSVRLTFDGSAEVDGGAGRITLVAEDLGRFKTPSLRDVARRGPYLHDGSCATLDEVVRYYDRGGIAHRNLDPRIVPLGLRDDERSDLVEFLGALTSDRRPGIGPARAARLQLRVVDLSGAPLAGLSVEIRPAGDRLEGGRPDDPSRIVVTDKDGRLDIEFPPWTHVRLACRTHEIHHDWPIPDCAPAMEVIAAPRDRIALRFRTHPGAPLPDALFAGDATGAPVVTFRLVRRFDDRTGIYATEPSQEELPSLPAKQGKKVKRVLVHPDRLPGRREFVAFVRSPRGGFGGRLFEVDLSGGWADPIDERERPEDVARRVSLDGCGAEIENDVPHRVTDR